MSYDIENAELKNLDPNSIQEPPWGNPRTSIADADRNNLFCSIRENGIHTPIHVRVIENGYELVAGWTRRGISIELGMESIPCLVFNLTDEEAFELSMSENVDRTAMSFLDEAKGLQRIVEQCNGDVVAAASSMGWSSAKFNKALQVLRASQKVQDLIGKKQENGFTVTVGHAAVLSILPTEQQNQIIDAVIAEKMPVAVVKDKVNRGAKRELKKAPFCTKECDGCKYNSNSEGQKALFEEVTDPMCSNGLCYNEKQAKHFELRKEELEKDYGKVVLLSTIASPLPINETIVGKEQFETGCRQCDKLCAVLADKGNSLGQIIENQCLDGACAANLMAKAMATTPKANSTATTSASNAAPNSTSKGKTANKTVKTKTGKGEKADTKESGASKKTTTAVQAEPPKRLVLESQTAIRQTAAALLMDHPSYHLSVTLAALQKQAKGNVKGMEDLILENMKLSPTQLTDKISEVIDVISYDTTGETFNAERAIIRTANAYVPEFEDVAVREWNVTKSRLKDMTKAIRLTVLEESGFAANYQDSKSEKEYKALCNKGTDEQVDLILAHDFDWSHYAPQYVKKAVSQQKYNY